MERVNPAHRAEEMPCRSRVKAVLGELILTFGHRNPRQRRRNDDSASHSTKGTAAAPRGVEAISKFNGECHRAAVALRISSFSHGLYPFSHELGRFNENLVF